MTVNNDIKIERHAIMKQIAAKQYAKIRPFLPVQRGNVRIPNIAIVNAVPYVLENGFKRCTPPKRLSKGSFRELFALSFHSMRFRPLSDGGTGFWQQDADALRGIVQGERYLPPSAP